MSSYSYYTQLSVKKVTLMPLKRTLIKLEKTIKKFGLRKSFKTTFSFFKTNQNLKSHKILAKQNLNSLGASKTYKKHFKCFQKKHLSTL